MPERKFLVAPNQKKIVGVLETMKVYRGISDGGVWSEDDVVIPKCDYTKTTYHHVAAINLYVDEDGNYWFAKDLIDAAQTTPRRSPIDVMDDQLRSFSDSLAPMEATKVAVTLFHALRRAGWLLDVRRGEEIDDDGQ